MNDQDVVDALRDLHLDRTPPRRDAQELLGLARHQGRRVTAGKVAATTAAVAFGAVAVAMLAGGHPAGGEVQMAPASAASSGPASGPGAAATGRPGYDEVPVTPQDSAVDAAVLREDLGPDFDVQGAGGGTLQPGTDTAAGLPAAYTVTIRFMDLGNGDYALTDFCNGPRLEKGLQTDHCHSRTLPDGRTVTEQWSRWPVGARAKGTAEGQQLRLMYLRPDHALVVLDVLVGQNQHPATNVTTAAVRTWIAKYEPRATAVATDPRLRADMNDGNEYPISSD